MLQRGNVLLYILMLLPKHGVLAFKPSAWEGTKYFPTLSFLHALSSGYPLGHLYYINLIISSFLKLQLGKALLQSINSSIKSV